MGIKSEYLQQNEINRNTNMIELNYNYLFLPFRFCVCVSVGQKMSKNKIFPNFILKLFCLCIQSAGVEIFLL